MEKVGVVGAGLMGSEIALVFAFAGHEVLLADRSPAQVAAGIERLRTLVTKGVARGFYTTEQAEAALSRVNAADVDAFGGRDYVTEAVFEDLAVKAEVLDHLDRICPPQSLIATNTSTIPISTLAAKVSPARRSRRHSHGYAEQLRTAHNQRRSTRSRM